MDNLATMEAINLDLMRTATVASLIATLKKFGRNHLLVVQNATDQRPRRVRGVITHANRKAARRCHRRDPDRQQLFGA